MSTENVIAKMREIAAEMFGIAPTQISEKTIIDCLGMDSLDRTEFVMALEEEYEIEIENEDCYESKTIGELATTVVGKIKAKGSEL